MTGLALDVGAVVVLPLAAPILRPLAKTAIEWGILAYQGAVALFQGSVSRPEAAGEAGREITPPTLRTAAHSNAGTTTLQWYKSDAVDDP